MIYWKIALLLMVIVGFVVLLHFLLFLTQKFIYKKSRKLFWLIPGFFLGSNLIFFGIYFIGQIFGLGCGKNDYIFYFSLGAFLILTLPNYLISQKISNINNKLE